MLAVGAVREGIGRARSIAASLYRTTRGQLPLSGVSLARIRAVSTRALRNSSLTSAMFTRRNARTRTFARNPRV